MTQFNWTCFAWLILEQETTALKRWKTYQTLQANGVWDTAHGLYEAKDTFGAENTLRQGIQETLTTN